MLVLVKKIILFQHLTTCSRKDFRENINGVSQTISLHRVQAPPRRSIYGGRFSDMVNTETLAAIFSY